MATYYVLDKNDKALIEQQLNDYKQADDALRKVLVNTQAERIAAAEESLQELEIRLLGVQRVIKLRSAIFQGYEEIEAASEED